MTSRSWLYRWWLRAQARWLVDVLERREAQTRSEQVSDYGGLSREALERRLRMAEDVCVMFGWTGTAGGTDREEAVTELWLRWARLVGSVYTGPDAHPELAGAEAALAACRRQTREATLAKFFGAPS